MKHRPSFYFSLLLAGTIFAAPTVTPAQIFELPLGHGGPACDGLPDYAELTETLRSIVAG